ncbi:hypothetical protein GW17_00030439, partial [Ensete ventricosum]
MHKVLSSSFLIIGIQVRENTNDGANGGQVTGMRTVRYRAVLPKIDRRWPIEEEIDRRRSIEREIDRRRSIAEEKGRRRGKKEKKKIRKNTSPARRGRLRPLFLPRGEKDRGDIFSSCRHVQFAWWRFQFRSLGVNEYYSATCTE